MYQNATIVESQGYGFSLPLAMVIVLLSVLAIPAQNGDEWSSYAPLRTDRTSIVGRESVLASGPDWLEFDTASAKFVAQFSRSECDERGWKVPADTLIALEIVPKRRTPINDSMINRLPFVAVESVKFYADRTIGLEYRIVRDEIGLYISKIRRVPKRSDAPLICKGFPEYDPLSEHYRPYDAGTIRSVEEWDAGRVVTTAEAARQNSLRAFVFVYCPTNLQDAPEKIIQRMNAFLIKQYGSIPGSLQISYGGVRSQCQFETFLIGVDQPEVRSRPTQSP